LIQFALFVVFVLYFVLRGTAIQPNWNWIALSPILILMMAGPWPWLRDHHLLFDHKYVTCASWSPLVCNY